MVDSKYSLKLKNNHKPENKCIDAKKCQFLFVMQYWWMDCGTLYVKIYLYTNLTPKISILVIFIFVNAGNSVKEKSFEKIKNYENEFGRDEGTEKEKWI